MSTLKDKTAVVTGSTSGIGLACARAFAGAGANVMLNGIGAPADVEKTRSAIEKDFGVKAMYSPANMGEPMEVSNMIALAERTFGRVDVLVNNAGIQHVAPIEEFPLEKWDAIIAINLSSAFHAIRAAVPGMKRRGWGRIINTASAHFAGRITLQICLRGSQARDRRSHQDAGAGIRAVEDHLQLHKPRLRMDSFGGEADPGNDEGTQHDRGPSYQGRLARGPTYKRIRHG
jgi:short chain dehydrogenase